MFSDIVYVNGKCNKTELIMTVLPPVLMGVLSFMLVINHGAVYGALAKDLSFMPPAVFPAIWLVTLLSMGIASYRAKRAAPESVSHTWYAAQLITAFIWNAALFRFGEVRSAFVIIIIHLFFLTAAFFDFDKADKLAGRLLMPQMVWALALAGLNFYLMR